MKQYFENGRASLMFAGALIVMFIVMLLVGECVYTAEAGETIVVRAGDMGRGMELMPTPYRNDPTAVAYSENFYSLQLGVATTRFGTTEFIDYNGSVTSGDVETITDFTPIGDSAAVVFCAGNKWYWSYYGKRVNNRMAFVDSIAAPREIQPRSAGVINYVHGDTTITGDASGGAYWVRNMQAGDKLKVGSDSFTVRRVVSDILAVVDSLNDISGNLVNQQYELYRDYNGSYPFLYASGNMVYSGSSDDRPQAVYGHNDTLFIRELKMVDSFYVDEIRNLYDDGTYTDTSATPDTTVYGFPCATCTTLTAWTERRSWDTTAGGDTAILEIQLVSRRADWAPSEWLQTPGEIPTTYFVRLGWHQNNIKNRAKFYPIRDNGDTAMYLSAWYVSDSLGAKLWRDSSLSGHGLRIQDTMRTSDAANSPWAYIYCATGFFDVLADDESTGSITGFGRGAVWKITDTSTFWVNPDTFYTGMYYLHLTADDIEFPSYTQATPTVSTYPEERCLDCQEGPSDLPLTQGELPAGDTIIGYSDIANQFCPPLSFGCTKRIYTIRRTTGVTRTVDAKYVKQAYFPIRYGEWDNDTLFIVTSTVSIDMLTDGSTASTSNWEIVRVGLPRWSGMTSWGNPAQLVAWGDTASPALISLSHPDDHWNWSAENDLIPGDLYDPVIGVLGYDDQILVFKNASIVGFNSSGWREISQSDGLVGPRAITGENKEVYFMDKDALKMIQRRDFSGYSIQPISTMLDPAFNAWTPARYNADVVPFTINPLKRHLTRLVYNPYDKHLYLFFPEGSDSTNSKCLTYDVRRQSWDGYLDLAVSDAYWTMWDDTVKIVCAGSEYSYAPDTAVIFAIDNVWEDLSNDANVDVAINAVRRSHKFRVQDESGRPIEARLESVRLIHRGQQNALAAGSRFVIAANRNLTSTVTSARDSVDLDVPGTFGDQMQYWRPSSDLVGTYWQYEIYVNGVTDGPYPYQIYDIEMEFTPVGEDD